MRWQVDGYVFAIYNVGMMDHAVGVQQLRVSDGVYHVVRFTRDGPNSMLWVDDFDQYKRPTGKTPRAVFDGRVRGFDPPQEVVDPQKVLQNLWGSTLTP